MEFKETNSYMLNTELLATYLIYQEIYYLQLVYYCYL